MKHLLFSLAICLSFGACKNTSTADTTQETPGTTALDTAADVTGTGSTSVDPNASTAAPQTRSTGPKVCNPNFNLLGQPKKNQYVYYVSGFNPGEFKCWNLLEEHGVKICNGLPCVIYYVDQATVPLTKTPPHFVDEGMLSTTGIGRFEHDGDFWEIKGARLWKRNEKVYGYYNTNEHLGG